MKIFVVVAVAVAFSVAALAWLFLASTRPHLVNPSREMAVRDKSGFSATVPLGSPDAAAIVSWVEQHQTGWRLTIVTYAPQTTFSTDTFHINLTGGSLVLNYSRSSPTLWNQVARSLSPDEQRFWDEAIARVKRPNQSMKLTAGSLAINF